MNIVRIVAIVLIVAGVLGLVYGSFSYTKETHETNIGPIELSVKEKQTVNVPVWAGGDSSWRYDFTFWKQEKLIGFPEN